MESVEISRRLGVLQHRGVSSIEYMHWLAVERFKKLEDILYAILNQTKDCNTDRKFKIKYK